MQVTMLIDMTLNVLRRNNCLIELLKPDYKKNCCNKNYRQKKAPSLLSGGAN